MAAAVSVKHLLFLLALFLSALPSNSSDFKVGWDLPHHKQRSFYTNWAAGQKFYVGDTIRFIYERESLMVVSRGEYQNCAPSHPILFSNGTVTYRFDRPGIFYFISGAGSNCNFGQRMQIKVEGLSPLPAASAVALSSSLLMLAVGHVAVLALGSCCF